MNEWLIWLPFAREKLTDSSLIFFMIFLPFEQILSILFVEVIVSPL